MKHYDNPNCASLSEFRDDLQRIKYIKKLITRYIQTGELKERLILNHLTILNNVFGPEILAKIILLKMKDQLMYIKPFLVFLNICPLTIHNVETLGSIFYTDDVSMDQNIVDSLRKI